MAQRILYGSLAILFLLALFAADAYIAERCGAWMRSQAALGLDVGHTWIENGARVTVPPSSAWLRTGASLLAHGSLIPILTVCMMIAGAVELDRLFRATGAKPYRVFEYPAIIFLVCSPWIGALFAPISPYTMSRVHPITAATALVVVALGGWTVLRRKPNDSLRDTGATLLAIVYLGLLPAFGLAIRCGPRFPSGAGAWLLLAVLLITKSSDIGAYFVGSAMGRHKLIPSVSPGKSVEGMIGGLLTSGFVATLIGFLGACANEDAALPHTGGWFAAWSTCFGYPNPSRFFFQTFAFGVALSIAAQFGDLLESCFKRDAGIKDTGNIMPRFGGVLDLVDSPILAMPVAWLLLAVVWGVV